MKNHELKKTSKMELWTGYLDSILFVLEGETLDCIIPKINPSLYFELNYEDLKEKYAKDDTFTIDNVDWNEEGFSEDMIDGVDWNEEGCPPDMTDYFELLSDFTDEYARSNGYYTFSEHEYTIYRAFDFLIAGSKLIRVFENQMNTSLSYIITDSYVSLEASNGYNVETGNIGLHRHVHKITKQGEEILDEPLFMIVEKSVGIGAPPRVVGIFCLASTLMYISELHEEHTFTTQKYREMLNEL